jgi:hypothetical protein
MSLPSARPIAFNRRLRASWLKEGLRLLADGTSGSAWLEHMEDLVRDSNSGADSVKKSMRYLRHIWLESGDVDRLRADAVALYLSRPSERSSTMLCWGMAIATYPFLNDFAAIVARLVRVQSEVKLEQILRKLSETYGERETVRRSGRYALGLLADFGFVKHAEAIGCYLLAPQVKTEHADIAGWFVRAWFAATASSTVIDRVVVAGAPSLAFFYAGSLISDAIETGALIPERLSFSQDVLRLEV